MGRCNLAILLVVALLTTNILISCAGPSQGNAVLHYNQGIDLREQGRNNEALQEFDEAIRLNPEYDNAYYNRGNTYYDLGQFERAIKDYDEAIRINPEADAYNNRGNSYRDLGQLERAMEDYDEAIRINPDHPLSYGNRALAYTLLGMDIEAQQDIERCVELGFDTSILETEIERVRKLR